jgi:hypothetical protein
MPAFNELEVCYFNLKPTTDSNHSSSGINPNAVPARASNYGSATPAQTSAAIFQSGGAEAFASARYWSSTELNASVARVQYFLYGRQTSYPSKSMSYRVRAVRRIPV